MVNPDKLSDKIIADLCHNLGIDPGDDESYKIISEMDPDEVIERFLTWNGIIGYGKEIRKLVHIVDEVDDCISQSEDQRVGGER